MILSPPLKDQPGCSGSAVLREVQCRVCSQLHQMFIAVPDLAKLVHFQVRDILKGDSQWLSHHSDVFIIKHYNSSKCIVKNFFNKIMK